MILFWNITFYLGLFYIWVSYLHIMPFRNIGVPVLHFVFVLVFHRLSTNVTPLFTETHLWFQAFHVHERPKSVNFTAGCFLCIDTLNKAFFKTKWEEQLCFGFDDFSFHYGGFDRFLMPFKGFFCNHIVHSERKFSWES